VGADADLVVDGRCEPEALQLQVAQVIRERFA
jgi:hypothetical protein